MMRSLFLWLVILVLSTTQAQTTKEMRDSLKAAARELSFHPD